MNETNDLASKLDEDNMIDYNDSDTVLLYGTEMNVEEPILAIETSDKDGHLKPSEVVCRDEEKKENYVEEVAGEDDPEEEVKNDDTQKEEVITEDNNEEDPDEEVRNDENPQVEETVEENDDEDPEEEVRIDENPKAEASIVENNEEEPEEEAKNDECPSDVVIIEKNDDECPEEEVKNDEYPRDEVNIEENDEEGAEEEVKNEEDARNDTKNKRKLEAIYRKKVSKLRKRPQMLKKKKAALRKKVKNALVSPSKLDEGGSVNKTALVSTTNDVGNGEFSSEKNDRVDVSDNGVAISNQGNINGSVPGDARKKEREIGKVRNDENRNEELQNEGDARHESKAKEKSEANLKKKANKLQKIDEKKKNTLGVKNEVAVNNREKPETSKLKATVKEKSKGMIFMCNSKTKKDCHHYQLLGLPASKRDLVFEIYEGMKLFLFDIDLKLMYGIYEAAGPGGYNIEPKAFNSAFPSQVRFSVSEDCLPLSEEKFKNIIIDNYYSKNKFDCQLNSKQVERLCKLFREFSKDFTAKQLRGGQPIEASTFVGHGPKRPPRGRKAENPRTEAPSLVNSKFIWSRRPKKAESLRAEAPRPVDREPKWSRRKTERLQGKASRPVDREPKWPPRNRKAEIPVADPSTFVDRKSKRSRMSRKGENLPFVDPKPKRLRRSPRAETQNVSYGNSRLRGWEDERHHTVARDHLYLEDPVAYRRGVYESPLKHPPPGQPLHLPFASSLPSLGGDVYRRDQLQYRDLRPLDVGSRHQDEFEHRGSYAVPRHEGDSYTIPRHEGDSYTIPRHEGDSYTIPRHEGNSDRGSYLASRGYSSYYASSSSAAQPSKYYPPASSTLASTYHLSAAPPTEYEPYRPAYRYYP